MPDYDISVVLQSDTDATSNTDFRNGDWELTGSMSTLTISDDDNNGLGDDDPSTETGAPATITAVDGDTSHPLVGTDIFGKYIRGDDEFGAADNTPDVLFLGTGSGFNNFAVTAFPGSGWSMQTGDRFTSNGTTTNDPTGGSWSREAELDLAPPCFTPGSTVMTSKGPVAVEALRPGDMVQTRDNGFQPLHLRLFQTCSVNDFIANPNAAPICIKAGALGPNMPTQDCRVSPMHLIGFNGPKGEEYLVYARDLLPRDGVSRAAPYNTAYIHLLFGQHEVLQADGMWSESFQISDPALARVAPETKAELLSLFPDLKAGADGFMPSVRRRISSGWLRQDLTRLGDFAALR